MSKLNKNKKTIITDDKIIAYCDNGEKFVFKISKKLTNKYEHNIFIPKDLFKKLSKFKIGSELIATYRYHIGTEKYK